MGNSQYSAGAYYMQTVPNSHSFGSLNNILVHDKYNKEYLEKSKENNGTFVYYGNFEPLTVEYLLIGFKNTIKREYEIKSIGNTINNGPVFSSVEDIITYLENNYNEKEFIVIIQNTLNNGLDLKCKRKMERTDVYKRIDGERNYQDLKWGVRREADGTPDEEKPVAEWINYMEFHLQKAKNAVYYLDTKEALAELRKVTALGVRAMEIHGCPERVILPEPDDKPNCCGNDCDCKK